MPIYVRKSIEPGSPQARFAPVILARNETSDRLQRILESYAAGNVNGRSFLISGHRGAGKSTLVRKVVHDAAIELNTRGLRPLLVVLPGPTLLPPENAKPVTAAEQMQAVLEQITLNLYRTLARHFADRYAAFIRELQSPTQASRRPGHRVRGLQLLELATAFRLALDGPVELAELRGYWAELGAMHSGILFDSGSPRLRQGALEIAALWSCLRSYLSIAASKFEDESKTSNTSKSSSEVNTKGSLENGIIPALLGLAGGGAVGAGVAGFSGNAVLSILAAIATAVGSGLVISYAGKFSRESSTGYESVLTLKRDMQSLARELPELIQRCRDAGIAPIFLVDELDKVERLEQRMESLIRNAKLFVSEQAVFFFVTDRAYFEYMEQRTQAQAYPREHTFFSERLFVTYKPADWRRYLLELLIPANTDSPAKEEETNAIDVLAFALLCRSRMHAIDLHRALSAITEKLDLTGRDDVDASVRAETLDLIGRLRFQLEVLMQIAVEVTLQEDAELMAAVNDDPNFLQVVYDALYFPSHAWRNEPQNPFSPSEDTLAKFLKTRSRAFTARSALLTDETSRLARRVTQVLFYLQNPAQLAPAAARHNIPTRVLAVVEKAPALVRRENGQTFTWVFDAQGRRLNPSRVEDIRDNKELCNDLEVINAVNKGVLAATLDKVNLEAMQRAGLLSPSPGVANVLQAVARLSRLQTEPNAYPDMDEDAHSAGLFAAELRKCSIVIARAVVSCWLLARPSTEAERADALQKAWQAFSDWLTGAARTSEDIASAVTRLFNASRERTGKNKDAITAAGFDRYEYAPWSKSLQDVTAIVQSWPLVAEDWDAVAQRAWGTWALQAVGFLSGDPVRGAGETDDSTIDQILCASRQIGPGRWQLKSNLGSVTIATWSQLALADSRKDAPSWVRPFSLLALGYDDVVRKTYSERSPDTTPLMHQEITKRSAANTTPRMRSKVLVAGKSLIIRNWLPEPFYACFALDPADISRAPELGASDVVFVQNPSGPGLPFEQKDVDAILKPMLEKGLYRASISSDSPPLPPSRIAILSSTTITPPPSNPVIVSPQTLSDAFSRLGAASGAASAS